MLCFLAVCDVNDNGYLSVILNNTVAAFYSIALCEINCLLPKLWFVYV